MTKLDINTKIIIILVISLLFLGSVRNYEWKTGNPQVSSSDQAQGSMNEPTRGVPQETLAIQSSGTITENSEEFSEGTMDNLTINDDGHLSLEKINSWISQTPSSSPSVRSSHSMVYDSYYDNIILFGGYYEDFGLTQLGDTWAYNLSTKTWTQKTPSPHPSARVWHAMVYDSTSDKTILFGGLSGSAETWVYDLGDDTWTQQTPPSSPSERFGHAMVYDSTSDKVILFGGYGVIEGDYLGDTWVYDLGDNTWTQQAPFPSPSARIFHAMVYDSTSDKTILFGGSSGGAETWVYDLGDDTWTQQTPPSSPSAREWHSMVYDSATDKVILFGGKSGFSCFGDTWVYDLGDDTWTQQTPSSSPIARSGHVMSGFSPGRVILFGGLDYDIAQEERFYNDTWVYGLHGHPKGTFESKLTYFGNIYDVSGEITWNPLTQPENTSLKMQVGFSNTSKDEDFHYSDYYTPNFPFGGLAQYMRYRVIFKSDVNQLVSPLLQRVTIYYSLETPRPTIQIIDPQNDSSVEGMVTVSALANSPNGIDKVSFYIGGHFISYDYSLPYSCSWNSNNSKNGYVSVMVVATSVLGKENADSILILVNNPVIEETDDTNGDEPSITVPNPPQSLSATSGDNFVELSWSAPSDDGGSTIMSYRVFRGINTGEYMFVGITTTTSFNDTQVLGDITYYYVVTAINAIGESAFSTEVSATPTGMTIPKSGTFPGFVILLVFLGTLVVITRKSKKT
ncbi:MAG: kelch repeat-containing protein [Candidatus Hodarchaeota archaeon]